MCYVRFHPVNLGFKHLIDSNYIDTKTIFSREHSCRSVFLRLTSSGVFCLKKACKNRFEKMFRDQFKQQ